MHRVLLLMPKTTYRAQDFLRAAEDLGVSVVKGTDRCKRLADKIAFEGETLVLDFKDVDESVRKIVAYAEHTPIDAVVAVDDPTTSIGARASKALGHAHNDAAGVSATRDKLDLRRRLRGMGLPQPEFVDIGLDRDPEDAASEVAESVGFPCVIKPRSLSASRGVIRADDRPSFARGLRRVSQILADPEVRKKEGARADSVVVEGFVPGVEVSVEALAHQGEVEILAIFDKPDPLDGPYFEEAIYVTPSRLSEAVQRDLGEVVRRAADGLGLHHGAIHAELRTGDQIVLIELAARSIGGLCSRTLRFGLAQSLESIILRHALGITPIVTSRSGQASGVLMLPIPRTGMLLEVHGLEAAKRVPGVEDVVITAEVGRDIVALPEGNAYPGFAFARGNTPDDVERALRRVRELVQLEVRRKLPLVS
jgi:biotin carboxylase